MKIRIYETIIECVDVEIEDGLEGDALEETIEHIRVTTDEKRDFLEVEGYTWEPLE